MRRGGWIAGFLAVAMTGLLWGGAASATPEHGIAMFGPPALPPDFAHLPYADPSAPKGGRIVFGVAGGFDSLNPFIVKGRAPAEIRSHTVESLLGRNWDEPFTLYGLLAETVETPLNRAWVEFTLRPEARFSDGAPVTVDDVVWSMEILAEKGRPGFRNVWAQVTEVERTGQRTVRFHLDGADREAPLILGLAPIFKRAQWERRDFAEPTLEPIIGSGPYKVAAVDPGRTLSLARDEVYWGRHLPFNQGRNNLDEIRIEYFRDATAHFDAFKAGVVTFWREGDPARWRDGYDFAAARDGQIRRAEIPHSRPTGMYGFVFNTRRPIFADIRVRRALTLAFNFEWINATMFAGGNQRIRSYFDNSPLAHSGPATERELEILAPFVNSLPEGALGAEWRPPESDPADLRNRRALRDAARLLDSAGWTVRDGVLVDARGAPFQFEILLGASADERVAGVFRDALAGLGIEVSVRTVDSAQYQARRDDYDFDMIVNQWAMSLSPGNEQRFYWGRDGVETPGTRNYMGVDSPAVEAAIDALLSARRSEDLVAAARALDRALSHGVYVIPFWHSTVSRIAHDARLRHPEKLPLYGDWVGWTPDVWWSAGQ
ncbi:extracellular solute-binding protein [Rubrimonas sp.]|uniref:extracellular solute-binding protein n=1 Tax=Rubrimonas sp. TaxID=2036015 RepID=UPI002FDEB2F8